MIIIRFNNSPWHSIFIYPSHVFNEQRVNGRTNIPLFPQIQRLDNRTRRAWHTPLAWIPRG